MRHTVPSQPGKSLSWTVPAIGSVQSRRVTILTLWRLELQMVRLSYNCFSPCTVASSDAGRLTGQIRLWKAEAPRTLTTVGSIPIKGHVNGLAFSKDGKILVAACGQVRTLICIDASVMIYFLVTV